jgi:hypothetical protein
MMSPLVELLIKGETPTPTRGPPKPTAEQLWSSLVFWVLRAAHYAKPRLKHKRARGLLQKRADHPQSIFSRRRRDAEADGGRRLH